MDALLAFITATVVSFWGSLQLGLINVAVVETTLKRDVKHALMLAAGGVLPEILYTFVAIYGLDSLGDLGSMERELGIGIGSLLILIGLLYLFRRSKPVDAKQSDSGYRKRGSFAKGLALAMLNPQLIFFWSGFILLFEQTPAFRFGDPPALLFDLNATGLISPKWAFALGAAFGAFLILCIYIYLSNRYKHRLSNRFQQRLNQVVGLFFVLIGAYSILRNIL